MSEYVTFTPGPWRQELIADAWFVEGGPDFSVDIAVLCGLDGDPHVPRNGALIVAATELHALVSEAVTNYAAALPSSWLDRATDALKMIAGDAP